MTSRPGTTLERGSRRSGGEPDPLERVTVNLTGRSSRALDRAVGLTNLNKTDSINRAIQFYAYIQEAIEAGGDIYLRPAPDAPPELLKLF